jgi:hypothetical protein
MAAYVLGAIRGSIGSAHGAKDDAQNRRYGYRTKHNFLLRATTSQRQGSFVIS